MKTVSRFEQELLLAHCLAISREALWTGPTLSAAQAFRFADFIERRVLGEPIAYILGERAFWDMRLKVTADTLIPRPETELLVEHILQSYTQATIRVLDVGTGSGAIALALARERPHWQITACDISPQALQIARENKDKYALNNVTLCLSDGFSAIDGDFDVIVSNPPYIKESDEHLSQGDVRFEPRLALVSGEQGLDMIAMLIQSAPAFLKPNGLLVLEHGYDQGPAVRAFFEKHGYAAIETHQDLAGLDRMTRGVYSPRSL